MAALGSRLVAQDRWLLLADGALANRPLDPVLPRLLQRDPERLLDRLTLILTEQRGNELLSPMARLLRTIGPPALGLLETRLYEARRQRVLAAIKLLAGADNDRLLRALPHALASWEWNLQDLAVSEVARAANAASAGSVAFVFSAILADAHPLVVPMMIDQIGVANQVSAVPLLIEIAAGEHESLRDQFVRIKAIEALGRMRAADAAALLHELTERRDGLSYSEPAGLRAAAEEALALIENRPSSARVRAAYETLEQITKPFAVHRRYARIPLESPLNAQIEGTPAPVMRVRTISLGGAYLESKRKLSVGDSIKLEIRSDRIENRPSSARVRAAYETLEQITKPFAVHRRYARIPLESPLNAQIEGTPAPVMRVRTISLGGAYLESKRKLSVGDSIKLEIR